MPSNLGVPGIFFFIYVLCSNDSNGFTSFKINVLKQRFLLLFLTPRCSASLSLKNNFHIATRSVKSEKGQSGVEKKVNY